jgi:NADPH2:quinone reductase
MKAIYLRDYDSTDNLVLAETTKPVPGPGEVLIAVKYAGLRWGDVMQRHGLPVRSRPTPFIPGQEAAGIVEAVGEGVRHFKSGDRVVALPNVGAYAEYVAVPSERVSTVPAHVPLERSLAYPVNLRTAYLMVNVWGKVQPGETVLLHAAAGGVGLMALQIMKRRLTDVCVIGLAGSDHKMALALENGADRAINYKTSDYVHEVEKIVGKKATGVMAGGSNKGGVDVAFNGVSGPTLQTDPKVIRKRGRWVIYGYSGGRGVLDTSSFGYDGITIMPFSSIAWTGTPEHEASSRFVREWMETEPLLEPDIRRLEDMAAVQREFEHGETAGKVVFQI